MDDGGCPSAPTREDPSPSPQPLGFSRAIPEDRLREQKGFLSAIANALVSQGSRPEISPLPAFAGSSPGRRTSSAFLLQTKPQGESPSPGLWAGGKGPAGRCWGRRCGPVGVVPVPSCGIRGNIRENALGPGWVRRLGTPPWERVGVAGLAPRG